MNYVIIFFRILHIFAGTFWVGSTIIMTFFIGPTIEATQEAGQKFVAHLAGKMKFSAFAAAAAGTTILAGIVLYWIDSKGFTSAWMNSGPGQGFGMGAGFAIIGFVLGLMIGRRTSAMAKLAGSFSGKPTAEQAAEMLALLKSQAAYSRWSAVFVVLAVIFMASARYLTF